MAPIRVKLYAILRQVAGADEVSIPMKTGDTANDLLTALAHSHPKLAPYLPQVAVVAGDEYIAKDSLIHEEIPLSLLPPVSGGAKDFLFLTYEAIPVEQLTRSLEDTKTGAHLVFLGTVRSEEHPQAGTRLPLTALYYEGHESLAEQAIQEILQKAKQHWPLCQATARHRLGTVPVGEASLFIGVATPHRAEAFEACREILEAIKHQAPIWKKEIYQDGSSAWQADGCSLSHYSNTTNAQHQANHVLKKKEHTLA